MNCIRIFPNPFSAKGACPPFESYQGRWGSASGGNPSTTIASKPPHEAKVALRVYNLLGQHLETVMEGAQFARYHQIA